MDFKKIEGRWQRRWQKMALYRARDFDRRRKKFYVLVEFPYPSGSGLHVGHAFTMTGADVYARKKRMEGYNVLFPMGWDAFGLPTENYAIKTGIHPIKVTQKNTATFRRQMKRMAFSFDWSREIDTSDPRYYRWTQWIFLQLFKHGLAYKEKMPINWCPSCRIGLANEEVINGKCERCGTPVERREISQWIVQITKYAERLLAGLEKTKFIEKVKAAQINWIGRSEGAKVRFSLPDIGREIEVFTTRPDTLWGVTFMVLAPEHPLVGEILDKQAGLQEKMGLTRERLQKISDYVAQARRKSDLERTELAKEKTGVFSGLYALNPVNGKKIPVWISDFVLISYGTGAIMAVPAHDQRDWQFAQKYHLPIVPVIKPAEEWDFNRAAYTAVEEGKMVNSGFLNGLAPREAIKKMTRWLEKEGKGEKAVSYHLRDWIFSRQHYWGEPMPMIYCATCAKKGVVWWGTATGKSFLQEKSERQITDNGSPAASQVDSWLEKHGIPKQNVVGWFPLADDQLPLELPNVERYQPTTTGESPLAAVKDWVVSKCPHCGQPARRETDTMPNWAGSDWYFLAYIFAKKLGQQRWRGGNIFRESQKLLQYWLPVDVYIGGDEHNTLHLLYSRFIYQFLWDIGAVPREYPEPYYRRISHGVILGPDGRRMSKSRGNVVNPSEVADKCGVDALRTYLMFIGPFEGTMVWNDNALRGVGRFLERFEKFIREQMKRRGKTSVAARAAVHRLVAKVGRDIDNFSFNTAVAALMEFLNTANNQEWRLDRQELKVLLQLLAPFAPYLTEELWHQLGEKKSIHWASWPQVEEKYLHEEQKTVVIQVNGKLRATLNLAAAAAVKKEEVITRARQSPRVAKYLAAGQIKRTIFIPGRLVNFVVG